MLSSRPGSRCRCEAAESILNCGDLVASDNYTCSVHLLLFLRSQKLSCPSPAVLPSSLCGAISTANYFVRAPAVY